MKKLIPVFLLFAACHPARNLEVYRPDAHGYQSATSLIGPMVLQTTTDTVCEWMHISRYQKGLVIAQTALAVRENGYCIAHLDCDKKPFPVHYHVGWCQGKDELLTVLNERRSKQ